MIPNGLYIQQLAEFPLINLEWLNRLTHSRHKLGQVEHHGGHPRGVILQHRKSLRNSKDSMCTSKRNSDGSLMMNVAKITCMVAQKSNWPCWRHDCSGGVPTCSDRTPGKKAAFMMNIQQHVKAVQVLE
jgi:hypothetical protein